MFISFFFFDVVIFNKIVKDFFSDDVPDFSNHLVHINPAPFLQSNASSHSASIQSSMDVLNQDSTLHFFKYIYNFIFIYIYIYLHI